MTNLETRNDDGTSAFATAFESCRNELFKDLNGVRDSIDFAEDFYSQSPGQFSEKSPGS